MLFRSCACEKAKVPMEVSSLPFYTCNLLIFCILNLSRETHHCVGRHHCRRMYFIIKQLTSYRFVQSVRFTLRSVNFSVHRSSCMARCRHCLEHHDNVQPPKSSSRKSTNSRSVRKKTSKLQENNVGKRKQLR